MGQFMENTPKIYLAHPFEKVPNMWSQPISNLVGGLEHFFILPFSWECHHPNWRTHIFQMGRYTTNQVVFNMNGWRDYISKVVLFFLGCEVQ